jgi:hypothetical protein
MSLPTKQIKNLRGNPIEVLQQELTVFATLSVVVANLVSS